MTISSQVRDLLIKNMQKSLKSIKILTGLTYHEISEFTGINEKILESLEKGEILMNACQYISLCAFIDNKYAENEDMIEIINSITKSKSVKNSEINFDIVYTSSLLNQWFLTFINSDEYYKNEENYSSEEVYTDTYQTLLEKLALNSKIFIDFSSFMHPGTESFLNEFTSVLKKYENKLIVPFKVVEKLQEIINENNELSDKAKIAISCIKNMQIEDVIEIRGQKDDPKDINILFKCIFEKYGQDYNLCLITQDKTLATEVFDINFIDNDSMLYYVNTSLKLNSWIFDDNSNSILKQSIDEYIEYTSNNYKKSEEQTKDISSGYDDIEIEKSDIDGGWEIL